MTAKTRLIPREMFPLSAALKRQFPESIPITDHTIFL